MVNVANEASYECLFSVATKQQRLRRKNKLTVRSSL